MEPRNFLANSVAPMVADTSVVINLDATTHFGPILASLRNRLLIPTAVEIELRRGEMEGGHGENALWEFIASGRAEVVALTPDGLGQFRDLTSGLAAETLGDGEAATIACAHELNAIALIDERKGLRISAERFSSLAAATTLQVLAHPQVQTSLGRETLSEAVFNALTRARMRVPQEYHRWVVDLIGADNVRKCHSLPRSLRLP